MSTSYFQNVIINLSSKPKREVIKAIKQEALQDFDLEFLQTYRFVKANSLNVRNGPSTKNAKIGYLAIGHVVKIIQKGRSWSKVEYVNEENNETITGWVFSRYLESFRK